MDTIGSMWGRDLSKGAAAGYIRVARRYLPRDVQAACNYLVDNSSYMPVPVDLGNLLHQNTRSLQPHPPERGEVATPSMETIGTLVNDFLRKTGQKRGKK